MPERAGVDSRRAMRIVQAVAVAIVSTGILAWRVAGCGGDGGAAPTSGAKTAHDGTGSDGGATDAPPAGTNATALPADRLKCPSGFTLGIPAGHHKDFASAGQKRSFDLLLPAPRFKGPRPLVFAFHGTGLSGAGAISDYHLDEWVDAGFVVIAPDSNGNGTLWPIWDSFATPGEAPRTNADLTLFDELLSCVAAHHPLDAKRLYVLGQSAGGAMTNFILGRRSSLLAGGIPASGMFDLTQPTPPVPIDPITVIVTWGGTNDAYSGSAGDARLANMHYAEQSALASKYWESQPGSHQIACRGDELGHVWLSPINAWMRDVLLAHPKGAAVTAGWTLPPLPAQPKATCSEDAATYKPLVDVACPTSKTAGCKQYCQMLGDCMVENGTLGPVAAEQLADLGFANTANVCSGCVSRCESDAQGSAADATALGCFATAAPATTCGPGFAGAAAFQTMTKCCGSSQSKVCARSCSTFGKDPLFAPMLSGCP